MEEGLYQEIQVLQNNKNEARKNLEVNQKEIKGKPFLTDKFFLENFI